MILAIIQARMGSTRLPGKILKDLAGKPQLWHVVNRVRRSRYIDKVIVATTIAPEDDATEKFCRENNFLYFRGSVENVLERYYETAKKYGATAGDTVVRITADCPLIDPKIIDLCLEAFKKDNYDYISNVFSGERTFPRGLDCEIFSFRAIEKAFREATSAYDKEHVDPYIMDNKKGEFKIGPIVIAPPKYARNYRLTVDFPEDFELMELIYKKFYKGGGQIISVLEVLTYLDENPKFALMNAHCEEKQVK
ncbi:MAG: glycosyltransferase family protein [Candidatus Harrisonbacteria bacterium]|nr:glycosyltransferase family protein [Candidatus Harrisonbacteria bacterium]